MKKRRLKKWVKVVLISLVVIIIGCILIKLDSDFMNSCIKAGYSKDYCIKEK